MRLTFVKELFAGFVRTRALGRHFRRFPLFDGAPAQAKEPPLSLSRELIEAAKSDPQQLLERLGTHPDGLTDAQAERIRERVGPNQVVTEKPLPWWLHLWHCYKTPFDLLLTLLAVVSYLTEDLRATTVIGSMVVLSVAIRFWQERKSSRAADELKAMVSNKATVLRRDLSEEVAESAIRYFGVQLHVKPPRRLELPFS